MQSLQQYDEFKNDFRKKLQQQWISYYSVDGISKQKSLNMRMTPNTPVEGAIYTLTSMMQQLDDVLTNSDEGTKQPRVQKGFNDLEKFFLNASKSGLLGKDNTLDKLLTKFPKLKSYIRKNIVSQISSEVVNNPNIDEDIKQQIVRDIPSIQQGVLLEMEKQENSSKAVSTVSTYRPNQRYLQLQRDIKQFLNHTGYDRLPETLQEAYEIIVDEMKNMVAEGNITAEDIAEIDEAIFQFEQTLKQTADEIHNIRSKQQTPSNNSLAIPPQMGNRQDTEQFLNDDERILVDRGDDYFSNVALSKANAEDFGDNNQPNKQDDFGETTILIQGLAKKLSEIPNNYKSKKMDYNKLSDEVSDISNELLQTDRKTNKGRPTNERSSAIKRAKEVKKKLTAIANNVKPKSAPALSGEGKPERKSRKSSKPKAVRKAKTPVRKRPSSKKKKGGCGSCQQKKKVGFLPDGIANF